MRVSDNYTNKFAIEPSSHGGYMVYRWKEDIYDYDGRLLEKPRNYWEYVSSYRSLRQANKYIRHVAQPTQFITVE